MAPLGGVLRCHFQAIQRTMSSISLMERGGGEKQEREKQQEGIQNSIVFDTKRMTVAITKGTIGDVA